MGFLDIFRKKVKGMMEQVQGAAQQAQPDEERDEPHSSQSTARPSGPTFEWDEEVYALPQGWSGLSMEDWFFKLETLRDELMHVEEIDLQPLTDEEGEPLDPEEVLLITKYGFQNGGQYEAFRNWGVFGWAAKTGESATDLEFRMGTIAREKLMGHKAAAMSGPGGALEPVEGVGVQQWAQIQAALAGSGNLEALLAQGGIDRPRWDRVSAEWLARMQKDTSHAIANVYSNAFAGASQGQFGAQAAHAAAVGTGGDLGAEPISFERYVEIMEAMSAASNRGEDANALLGSFGLSALDWSNVSMYWSKRMSQEATKYHQLFTQYSEKYSRKYAG